MKSHIEKSQSPNRHIPRTLMSEDEIAAKYKGVQYDSVKVKPALRAVKTASPYCGAVRSESGSSAVLIMEG